ncbi:hypothetical protein S245_008992, partial [Arachis hypogaea]
SKQIFARWQAILSCFDFTIEHINGEQKAASSEDYDTKSIKLTHYRNLNTKQPIYSKIKIIKILSLQEWEIPPYQSKSFSLKFEPQNYTYYDYQEAWNQMLFLSPSSHSWFIWFRNGISLQFPKWFQAWFQNFGTIEAFFPKEGSMAYEYFKSKLTFLQEYKFISFIAA